ncbi:TRAP-type C4-dicarboxylate transport system, large permease component [Vibrio vulnificus YJ016]|jgi:tripartite ATP-independent transporter DctM subunit|uniref:TRAP transporter large permease protein n=2 Tax=Vibrio vulnificus TaxID=672 RepID=Q7ML50_VIBVY|nr:MULTISPECIES: TRAP transporter large permease [Vibrio]AUL95490.1 TRAP dicarboxylate transporter, DctM subunit, unknown substrate 3 [Vibrio vulnificus]EGQ7934318.1 TRAP transporter large permease [Vibrio vulnificus]EGQ8079652.1 TRAP transporter large permease [Vibrio vulnificus]EGQ9933884.1 TRAP transporter large permease [Vibrio vulnificus]EGR0063177.1 TRAP transporter large permease [Vibrio vulnificus]
MIESIVGFSVLIALILLRLPLAFAMGVIGFIGFWYINDYNWTAAMSMAARRIIDTGQDYGLSVIPLFILMGNFVTKAGISNELYKACNAFVGHRRGGLSMSTILACGGFSAICGSSLATSATMSKVAMPPMRKYGYSDGLASASIAAGGTLGILIPPSVMLVIYGLLTETSIRELFAAGFLPGLLGIVLYLLAVQWVVSRKPESAPPGERVSWKGRLIALKGIFSTLLLFVIVMGGIYIGAFTPTEAAGIGACGAFALAGVRGKLNYTVLREILIDTAKTSASLFAVVISALILSNFVNRAGLPTALVELIQTANVTPMMALGLILVIYIILGCVFESMSMMLLTVPIFYPVIVELGFDPIWFGIIVVVVTEISLITPPVGLNVFVLSGLIKDINTATIFRGVLPFWVADMVRLALIVLVPAIALYLPNMLY